MRRCFGFSIATLQKSRKCKYFNFVFHTVPAEMLYLLKYLTDFLKRFFCWKNRKVAILVENLKCNFSFCSSSVTTFPTSRKCKNFNFSIYQFPAEMLYLQKYFTNFLNLFFGWKKWNLAIVVENLECADISVFHFNFAFQLSQLKCYISRSIIRIF